MRYIVGLKVGIMLYFVGEKHIYVALLNQEGDVRIFQLMECKKAFVLIDQIREVMDEKYLSAKKVTTVFHNFSFNWGKYLLPPLESLSPFDILVIIPHHTLHGLPFHAVWQEKSQQFMGT